MLETTGLQEIPTFPALIVVQDLNPGPLNQQPSSYLVGSAIHHVFLIKCEIFSVAYQSSSHLWTLFAIFLAALTISPLPSSAESRLTFFTSWDPFPFDVFLPLLPGEELELPPTSLPKRHLKQRE
jgi:hypothetical protein